MTDLKGRGQGVPLAVHHSVDPLVAALFRAQEQQKMSLLSLESKSGVGVAALRKWKRGGSPRLADLRAALAVVGVSVEAVVSERAAPREVPVPTGWTWADIEASIRKACEAAHAAVVASRPLASTGDGVVVLVPRVLAQRTAYPLRNAEEYAMSVEMVRLISEAVIPLPTPSRVEGAICAARRGNIGASDPQDCDWPGCGCDPHADKVIAALDEQGLLRDKPVFTRVEGAGDPVTGKEVPCVIKGHGFQSQGGGFAAIEVDGVRYTPVQIRAALPAPAAAAAAAPAPRVEGSEGGDLEERAVWAEVAWDVLKHEPGLVEHEILNKESR